MSKRQKSKQILVFDVGTSSVKVLLAYQEEKGNPEVASIESVNIPPMWTNGVINIAAISNAVSEAASRVLRRIASEEPEQFSPGTEVVLGISTAAVQSYNAYLKCGVGSTPKDDYGVGFSLQPNPITHDHMVGLHKEALLNKKMLGMIPLHLFPSLCWVDTELQVLPVIGVEAVSLDLAVQVVSVEKKVIDNLRKAIAEASYVKMDPFYDDVEDDVDELSFSNATESSKGGNLGLVVNKVFSSSIASSIAVTSEKERENGVLVADIGHGTLDLVYLKEGRVFDASVGACDEGRFDPGANLVNNLAKRLNRSPEEAMELLYSGHTGRIPRAPKAVRVSRTTAPSVSAEIFNESLSELARVLAAYIKEYSEKLRMDKYVDQIPTIVVTGGLANNNFLVNRLEAELSDLENYHYNSMTTIKVHNGTPEGPFIAMDNLKKPEYASLFGLLLSYTNSKITGDQLPSLVHDPRKSSGGFSLFGLKAWSLRSQRP